MLALGCVQSLICNTNRCPTGVATQDPSLSNGLVVRDKAKRVARFHSETVKATAEIIASAGLRHTCRLNRSHLFRRVSQEKIARYDEIFPYLQTGDLLQDKVPERFEFLMNEASVESFEPDYCPPCDYKQR